MLHFSRTLVGASAIVVSLAAPAIGSEVTTLAAQLSHGLVDGEQLFIYSLGTVDVQQTDEATFTATITHEGRATSWSYAFTEPEPCLVQLVLGEQTFVYDFTKLTDIVVTSRRGNTIGKPEAMHSVEVMFEPKDEVAPTSYQGAVSGVSGTGVPAADFERAASRLLELCR